MYALFNYSKCKTAMELLARARQNTIIIFLRQQNVIPQMERKHYINHTPLYSALKTDSIKRIDHAFMELVSYLQNEESDSSEILSIMIAETVKALEEASHDIHRRRHTQNGRKIKF